MPPSERPKISENASAFKHLINEEVFLLWSRTLQSLEPRFNRPLFLTELREELKLRELKARIRFLGERLSEALPIPFLEKLPVFKQAFLAEEKLHGFAGSGVHDLISREGLSDGGRHFESALRALRDFTEAFSSEFAVQAFLHFDVERTLKFLRPLVRHQNEHVRRWVSEGTRARLPWGIRFHSAIKDPSLTVSLIQGLRHDPSLYVRKSVANHLNDLSKDHPEMVVNLLRNWSKSAPESEKVKINWISRHALRSLIKSGDPRALALFGWHREVKLGKMKLALTKASIKRGEKLTFSLTLTPNSTGEAALDYRIYHRKKNGLLQPKVFKWKTLKLRRGEEILLVKSHSFRKVTTRIYYPGAHALGIQLNGREIIRRKFNLA